MTSHVLGRHRDHVESRISSIWEDVLGVELVMPDDDFFDLGGDSVRALLCCARINATLGSVRLSDFFERPTPAGLAQLLRASPELEAEVGVVPIADIDQAGAPLFFVHAATGEVMFLRNIRSGTFDRPVYGIRSPGFDGSHRPASSVAEMAADYVDQILRVHPEGPLLLAGYSAGAVIAFEMALQLERIARSPSFLGLVDPPVPGPDPEFDGSIQDLKRQRAAFLLGLYDLPQDWLEDDDPAEGLRGTGAIPPDWSAAYFDRTLEVWAANSFAVTHYSPGSRWAGAASLYVAAPSPDAVDTGLAGMPYWLGMVSPRSEVKSIAADHLDVMRHPDLYPSMRAGIAQALAEHAAGDGRVG